jgi:drug/metabolite transporter (DMT)-like permease
MVWLLVTIVSYFINAGVYVADKFLLSKKIHSSITYAFYVGIWSIFNFVLLFFDPWMPGIGELLIDMSAGVLFLITLIFWYKALHQSEATRVVPIVGALVPIFSFTLSYMFLGEKFDQSQILAFAILIAGGVMISVKRTKLYIFKQVHERVLNILGKVFGNLSAELRPTRRLLTNSIMSAFFFAAYYVLMKHIYMNQPFIGSFVWSRFGTFVGVLCILAVPEWRKLIKENRGEAKAPRNLSFFLIVRFFAAMAFIMLNWAISLGNVAMTNALQGAQYLFLIFIVIMLSARFPNIFKEELGRGVLIQKMIGVVLVSLGLWVLIS